MFFSGVMLDELNYAIVRAARREWAIAKKDGASSAELDAMNVMQSAIQNAVYAVLQSIDIRPEIMSFARAMERVMKSFDSKEDFDWKRVDWFTLKTLLEKEFNQLFLPDPDIRQLSEVASVCMMLWNRQVGFV